MKCPGCGMEMETGEAKHEAGEAMAMRQIIEIAAKALAGESEHEAGEVEGEDTPEAQDVRATALRMKSD